MMTINAAIVSATVNTGQGYGQPKKGKLIRETKTIEKKNYVVARKAKKRDSRWQPQSSARCIYIRG